MIYTSRKKGSLFRESVKEIKKEREFIQKGRSGNIQKERKGAYSERKISERKRMKERKERSLFRKASQ